MSLITCEETTIAQLPYANPQKAREWLAANRDRILQLKRQRYAVDTVYAAEKVAERSRDTMKRNRKRATLRSFLFNPRLMDADNPLASVDTLLFSERYYSPNLPRLPKTWGHATGIRNEFQAWLDAKKSVATSGDWASTMPS